MQNAAALFIALAVLAGAPSTSEGAEGDTHPMDQVSFLVGNWVGDGWMQMGPGGRQTFRGTETVESRLDGRVLIIEGVHESSDGEQAGEEVHHALAVLSWDEAEGTFRFRSHLASGRSGDFTGRVEDGAFIWGMELPGRSIRYTIGIDDEGRWHEIGVTSTDGETWHQFFEMTLQRVD
jgi:hypothetical protein